MPATIPAHLRRDRLFAPGRVTITPAAQEALRAAQQSTETLVARHCAGDFGEVSSEDRNANLSSIQRGGQVTSIFGVIGYPMGLGREHIWVHTSIREGWTYLCVQSEADSLV